MCRHHLTLCLLAMHAAAVSPPKPALKSSLKGSASPTTISPATAAPGGYGLGAESGGPGSPHTNSPATASRGASDDRKPAADPYVSKPEPYPSRPAAGRSGYGLGAESASGPGSPRAAPAPGGGLVAAGSSPVGPSAPGSGPAVRPALKTSSDTSTPLNTAGKEQFGLGAETPGSPRGGGSSLKPADPYARPDQQAKADPYASKPGPYGSKTDPPHSSSPPNGPPLGAGSSQGYGLAADRARDPSPDIRGRSDRDAQGRDGRDAYGLGAERAAGASTGAPRSVSPVVSRTTGSGAGLPTRDAPRSGSPAALRGDLDHDRVGGYGLEQDAARGTQGGRVGAQQGGINARDGGGGYGLDRDLKEGARGGPPLASPAYRTIDAIGTVAGARGSTPAGAGAGGSRVDAARRAAADMLSPRSGSPARSNPAGTVGPAADRAAINRARAEGDGYGLDADITEQELGDSRDDRGIWVPGNATAAAASSRRRPRVRPGGEDLPRLPGGGPLNLQEVVVNGRPYLLDRASGDVYKDVAGDSVPEQVGRWVQGRVVFTPPTTELELYQGLATYLQVWIGSGGSMLLSSMRACVCVEL